LFELLGLIERVLREREFRPRLNSLSFTEDARQELRIHFTPHPEKLGLSPAYTDESIRNKLRDILNTESERGLCSVPREVRQVPKGLGKDSRKFVLEFSSYDGDDVDGQYDEDNPDDTLNRNTTEPFAVLRSQCCEAIIAELQQRSDYQQLLQACEADTLAAKSVAMECKPSDVRQRMKEAGQRITANIRERMGRLAG
jgi:hypothetical protein